MCIVIVDLLQTEGQTARLADESGETVVSLDSVSKHYRSGGGIDDVTLRVRTGEVFGFLGPNGAGKTTTIRLLLDLIRPDSGGISIFGLDPRKDGSAVRRRLGYLPGDLALYERLTARELLSHFAHLRGGPPWREIDELCERVALEVDRPIRSLSKGNRQKVGLVQALMGRPELLVLDEPSTGLDPLLQHTVHEMLRAASREGRTVFLSSHVLSEVQQVADRVAMIRSGRVVATERVSDLRSRSMHYIDVKTVLPLPPGAFSQLAGVATSAGGPCSAHLEVTGSLDPVVRELARYDLEDVSIREPDLEDVFLSYYEDEAPTGSRNPVGVSDARP